jgi:hypothetical protein
MSAIELVEKSQLAERPAMKSGDTVRVHVKVREGDKERIQVFEGVVIGLHRGGTRASFTVRNVVLCGWYHSAQQGQRCGGSSDSFCRNAIGSGKSANSSNSSDTAQTSA